MKRNIKTTNSRSKKLSKLSKSEFEKYLAKIEDPNYQGGSWALPEKASLLEKTKHNICKKMIVYKREKKLSSEKLAQKINLSLAETEDILHYRTDYFTLDRLMTYTSKLFPTSDVEISLKDKEKRTRFSHF